MLFFAFFTRNPFGFELTRALRCLGLGGLQLLEVPDEFGQPHLFGGHVGNECLGLLVDQTSELEHRLFGGYPGFFNLFGQCSQFLLGIDCDGLLFGIGYRAD